MQQLQFLALMIRKEDAPVPIEASARTELIDLMARILVVVFQTEGEESNERALAQPQDQAGAPGSQSHRLLTAIQRQASTAE